MAVVTTHAKENAPMFVQGGAVNFVVFFVRIPVLVIVMEVVTLIVRHIILSTGSQF
jgi:hypothetical protein